MIFAQSSNDRENLPRLYLFQSCLFMKVLITGGIGRVGANLANRLLTSGHDVTAFVYPANASRADKLAGFQRIETLEGDLRHFADCQKAVDGVDANYRLAAAFGGPFDNRDYLAINSGGTLNLLEAVRAQRPKLHRLVYACTEAIYCQLTDRIQYLEGRESRYFANAIRESDVSPYLQMPYFLTKRIVERLVMAYHLQYGVPSVSFRFTMNIEPSEFLNADGLPPCFYSARRTKLGAIRTALIRERKPCWTKSSNCGPVMRNCCYH